MKKNRNQLRITKFADPTVDFAFKRIFGTEKYKAATIGLLNSIIPDKNIQEVSFINVEIPGMTEDGKKSFIDVLCTSDDGSTFICEMQNLGHTRFLERMVFYSSTVIANSAIRGNMWEYDLKPTYVIAFLNFNISDFYEIQLPEEKYMSTFMCQEVECGVKLPSSPEFHFIELKKFKKEESELCGETEKWIYLLRSATELEEIPEEFNGSAAFEAYFEAAETAGFSKEEMAIYIKDMTTKWDIELAMKEHLEKGRKEGLEQGLEQGRAEGREEGREDAIVEMAKKMLADNQPVESIVKYTGLTPEQIKSLE